MKNWIKKEMKDEAMVKMYLAMPENTFEVMWDMSQHMVQSDALYFDWYRCMLRQARAVCAGIATKDEHYAMRLKRHKHLSKVRRASGVL